MAEPQLISASRNLVQCAASSQTSYPSIVSRQLEPEVTNSKCLFKFTCLQFSSLQWVMVNLTWTHLSQLPLALLLNTMTLKSLSITTQMNSQPPNLPERKPLKGNERKHQQQLLLKLQLSWLHTSSRLWWIDTLHHWRNDLNISCSDRQCWTVPWMCWWSRYCEAGLAWGL